MIFYRVANTLFKNTRYIRAVRFDETYEQKPEGNLIFRNEFRAVTDDAGDLFALTKSMKKQREIYQNILHLFEKCDTQFEQRISTSVGALPRVCNFARALYGKAHYTGNIRQKSSFHSEIQV